MGGYPRGVGVKCKHVTERRRSRWRRLSGAACGVYLLVIVLFTLGKTHFEIPGVWRTENQKIRAVKPYPLDDLFHWNLYSAGIDYLGNTALFLPFGFLLAVWLSVGKAGEFSRMTRVMGEQTAAGNSAFCSVSLGGVALLAFLTSFFVEVVQYIVAIGRSDVDDLIFNTLGAVLGALLARRVLPWQS